MKEFPKKGGPEPALTDSSKKIDGHGTTDRRPGSGRPKSVTVTSTVSFATSFVYFSCMYSCCDLSTCQLEFLYEYMDMDKWND